MDWRSLLITVISNAVFIGLATAFIKYFFDQKLEKTKRETALYMMRSQTLHVKRAEAIEEIYTNLEKAIRYISDVMNPIQLVSDAELKKRADEASHIAQAFKEIYSAKKIYLPPRLAKQLDAIDKKMIAMWFDFIRNHPKLSGTNTWDVIKWSNAWKAFTENEIPKMLRSLEKEFRQQLGSDVD